MRCGSGPVGHWVLAVTMLLLSACRPPKVGPLQGRPTLEPLPVAQLPGHPQQLRFRWHYVDRVFTAAGDGVVRSLPPDSARLDFFLADGSAGGVALLVGDTLSAGDGVLPADVMPAVPLLWAALGRLALPAARIGAVHRLGDSLFAEVSAAALSGSPALRHTGWRLAFVGEALVRMEEVVDGRLVASVARTRSSTGQWMVHYVARRARRRLQLDVQDTSWVERFDDAIWRRP